MTTTLDSITGQFAYWRKADMPAPLAPSTATRVVVGCGTSYNLALSIAAALSRAGQRAIAVPAGEWVDRPDSYLPRGERAELIALSRSGTTTETLRAVEASQARGEPVIGLTCDPDATLAQIADRAIAFETHPQEGIVMTASASLMLLAGGALAGLMVDAALADRAEALLLAVMGTDTQRFHDRSHIVFLGGGAQYGVALEGALKLMEMALCPTQGFHPGEYRHGPVSLVDAEAAFVMLYHDDTCAAEAQLVAELQDKGACVIGFGGPGDISFPVASAGDLAGVEILPALQLLGERHAHARGLDTTAPRHLTKVVVLP